MVEAKDMLEIIDDRETYLSDFGRIEKEDGPSWLTRVRKKAIERFDKLGFPTLRNEEWRFTNLAPLTKVPFHLPSAEGENLSEAQLPAWASTANCRLVFVNGRYAPKLSRPGKLPAGVVLGNLAAHWHSDLVQQHLSRHASFQDHSFTALNTAFIQDGAVLFLPQGRIAPDPIHLVFVSTVGGEPTVSHPRNLIVAGAGSQAAIVETYLGSDGEVYLTNAVTEVVAEDSAVVDHYKIQEESADAFHLATLGVRQGKASKFTSCSVALGAALARNEIHAGFAAEGGECTLNGLYMATGQQLIDNHTVIDHAQPRCVSHELYKGILADRSRGVFSGKIYVRQDAQKTDAKQTNQTLLLSEDATINTKPQLEIYADDVKCTHGATVGQLDEEALFYLRSRGIGRALARSLLIFAFANDIIGRIKVDSIRARLEERLLAAERLPPEKETR
jgi:Fe-S cluster assembly protein SufD